MYPGAGTLSRQFPLPTGFFYPLKRISHASCEAKHVRLSQFTSNVMHVRTSTYANPFPATRKSSNFSPRPPEIGYIPPAGEDYRPFSSSWNGGSRPHRGPGCRNNRRKTRKTGIPELSQARHGNMHLPKPPDLPKVVVAALFPRKVKQGTTIHIKQHVVLFCSYSTTYRQECPRELPPPPSPTRQPPCPDPTRRKRHAFWDPGGIYNKINGIA